jgi:hypothetical protein
MGPLQQRNLGGIAVFENATDTIQKHMTAGDYAVWVLAVVALVIAWIIFMVIREFWCWYFKTTRLANELQAIHFSILSLQEISLKCQLELKTANSKLAGLAQSASATVTKPPRGLVTEGTNGETLPVRVQEQK